MNAQKENYPFQLPKQLNKDIEWDFGETVKTSPIKTESRTEKGKVLNQETANKLINFILDNDQEKKELKEIEFWLENE